MKSYSEISNRYIKENKKRTALTILGITLATILIFAIGTFILSFRDSMIEDIRSKGDFEFIITQSNSTQTEKIMNNAEIKNYALQEDGEEFYIEGSDRKAQVENCDKGYYERIRGNSLTEGRAPETSEEIVLDRNTKSILNIGLNDKLTLVNEIGDKKQVTIVGFTEGGGYSSSSDSSIRMFSYLDNENLDSNKQYSIFVNLNSAKDKQTIIKNVMNDAGLEVNKDTKDDNSELLYLTGNGGNEGITNSLSKMAIFVIAVIMICTITVIYNSFNISVIERIRYFGILKAIGATPKQIKRIIYREGFAMGLAALPIACLIGFFGLKFGIKIFIGDSLMMMENFKVRFYPEVILLAAVLEFITIWFSLLAPARKAKKVSAVEAMRNQNEIKLGKIKNRKNRITKKLFGIEGSIAYKNIRRTPFRFFVTVLALTISIVLFNVFYGFLDQTKAAVRQIAMNVSFDSELCKIDNSAFTDEEIKDIKGNINCDKSYEIINELGNFYLPTSELNPEYESKTGMKGRYSLLDDLNYTSFKAQNFYVGDMDFINISKDYVLDGELNEEKLKEGGVVLIDGTSITNSDGKKEIVRITNYKAGDKIKIPKLKDYNNRSEESTEDKAREAINKNEYIELPVVAIVSKDIINGGFLNGSIEIVAHKDGYSKLFKDFRPNEIAFKFAHNEENRESAVKYFNDLKSSKDYVYYDMGEQVSEMNKLYTQVEFFVYGFIIIITIISIVNIFNTISTNLLLRKKEFSTLKAIGMEEKQLKKSVMFEGTLYGILAAVFGGILSAVLLKVLVDIEGGLADLEYHFNYLVFIASLIAAIGVTYIFTLIPLRRLKKLTIVEGIRDDE